MKLHLVFALCVYWTLASGQSANETFISPLDGPVVLSGSFAEPRTSHFHAGIDFKPHRGVPFDTVRAIQNGYISRINVRPDGYGNALYINHPSGHTSVYAHLDHFNEEIKAYIENILIKRRKYDIEHYLKPSEIEVKKGEYIGIMGNSGRSSGAHLHFEIRHTKDQSPINPAKYQIKPADTRNPIIKGIIIYSLSPLGEILSKEYFAANHLGNGKYHLGDQILKYDALSVGIGIHVYDQMNGASNHNGIYRLEQVVDGESTFKFSLDTLSFSTTKYLHEHMDYAEKLKRRYVTKCFVNPNNPLTFYKTDSYRGKIQLFEDIARKIQIHAGDFEGNVSSVEFYIKRSAHLGAIVTDSLQNGTRIFPQDSMVLHFGMHTVQIEPFTILSPTLLRLDSCSNWNIYLAQDPPIPTFKSINLSTRVPDSLDHRSKLVYIAKNDKGEFKNYGGTWLSDSTLTTNVGGFDNYTIMPDLEAPKITLLTKPDSTSRELRVRIKDNFEPVYRKNYVSFTLELNGEWVLCTHDLKTNSITYNMKNLPENMPYTFVIRARDYSGNTSRLVVNGVY